MVRKLRIAAVCAAALAIVCVAALWFAYQAARQVRPFYRQALALDSAVLERGRQELESRATALYSDAQKAGAWHALFTDEQINGWLASQLATASDEAGGDGAEMTAAIREPRVAISPGLMTLGFTTKQGGVDTVVSVDASVFLTEGGEVAVRFEKVRAGSLPLPVALVADELATACRELSLPVMWSENKGQPLAMIKIGEESSSNGPRWFIDAIELAQGELYVAGHTDFVTTKPDIVAENSRPFVPRDGAGSAAAAAEIDLGDYELRLSAPNGDSMLEVARRSFPVESKSSKSSGR